MVFLTPIAMLKAVPNENAGFIILFTSFFILFYFMRSLSMSFYFIIKTSSRFNGFYRNPAGLPSFTPVQGDIALAGLPRQGSTPPHVAYSGIVHLLCDGPAHLVLLARWRGFVVLLYEVLFSCRAGLQVPYGPQMLEGPCLSSQLIARVSH